MLARLVGVLLGLLLLSLVFGVIERLWPSIRGQRRFRRGLGTDLAWWFWLPTVNQALTFVTVAACAVVVAIALGHGGSANEIRAFLDRDTWVSRQPIWLQFVMLLVLMDLAGYWSHRLFHGQGILWRFHAVHHSSEEVDWLSSVRVHPVNEMG
ncbi:MAG: sterol desaturase family protein, partial [Dehalococcoidia bacterium]